MGYSFQENITRQDLINQLVQDRVNSTGTVKVVKHSTKGNTLWLLLELTELNASDPEYVIECCLLEKLIEQKGNRKVTCWGYKSILESCYPFYFDCPLSYLKIAPVRSQEWRERVKQYHHKYSSGDQVMLKNCVIPSVTIVSNKPLIGSYQGIRYRIPRESIIEVVSQAA